MAVTASKREAQEIPVIRKIFNELGITDVEFYRDCEKGDPNTVVATGNIVAHVTASTATQIKAKQILNEEHDIAITFSSGSRPSNSGLETIEVA